MNEKGGKSSECKMCQAGTYGETLGGQSTEDCRDCPAGSYSDQEGQLQCTPCPAGTYLDETGADSEQDCTPCLAGFFSTLPGMVSAEACEPCPKGTASAARGASTRVTCTACPKGEFGPSEGAEACDTCPPEETGDPATTPSEGSTLASDCSSVDDGAVVCEEGEGASADDQAECAPCAPGAVNPGGRAFCEPCAAGTHANAKQTECVACARGTFSARASASNASSCVPCPAGFYSDDSDGASACVACPAGQMGAGGASTDGGRGATRCEAPAAGAGAIGDNDGDAPPGEWVPLGAAQPISVARVASLLTAEQRAELVASHEEGGAALPTLLVDAPSNAGAAEGGAWFASGMPGAFAAAAAAASAAKMQCFDGGRMCIGTEVSSSGDAGASAAALLALLRVYLFSAAGVIAACLLLRFLLQPASARLGWARFDKLFNSAHAVPSTSMPAVVVQRRTGLGGLATLIYGAVAAAALSFLLAQFALANVVVTRAIDVRSADVAYTSSSLRLEAALVGSGVNCGDGEQVTWEQTGLDGPAADGRCAAAAGSSGAGDSSSYYCAVECALLADGSDGWRMAAGEARLTLRFPAVLAYALRWRLVAAAPGDDAKSALFATLVAARDDEALQGDASWALDALPASRVDATREPPDVRTGYTLIFSGYDAFDVLRAREALSAGDGSPGASSGESMVSVTILLNPIGLASTETRSNALSVTQFLPIAFSAMTGILALARFLFKKADGAVEDDDRVGRQPLRDVHAAVHATLSQAHEGQALGDTTQPEEAKRRRSTLTALYGLTAEAEQTGNDEEAHRATLWGGDAIEAEDAAMVSLAMDEQSRKSTFSANPLYSDQAYERW